MPRLRVRVAVGIMLAALTAAVAVLLLAAAGVNVFHSPASNDRLQADSAVGGVLVENNNETALPGQITDFSAVVTNPGTADAVLVSATLIPLPGYPVPQLLHLGLVATATGPLIPPAFSSALGSDYGWPPHGIKVRPFTGANIRAHAQTAIAFGISGDRFGSDYAVAGLRIHYRLQGHLYNLNAWSAALDCISSGDEGVPSNLTNQQLAACDSALVTVDSEAAKMAGDTSPDCTFPPVPPSCRES